MKILIFLLTIFIPSTIFAEVYYCVERDSTGFDGANNYVRVDFNTNRFSVDIDFNNLSLSAPKIMIDTNLKGHVCSQDDGEIMQCINSWGFSFTINMRNLKFVKSAGLGYVYGQKSEDDLNVSYGQCELF